MAQQQQKQKLLSCHCLNVQLYQEQNYALTEQQQSNNNNNDLLEILDHYSRRSGHNNMDDKELDQFLINSKLIKILPSGIKINYEYLCLKRIIDDNLQIVFCAVCELETHAIFISKTPSSNNKITSTSNHLLKKLNNNNSSPAQFALVHSLLLNNENKISELKSSLNYSPALGIVLPDSLISYSDLNELKHSDSGIGKTFSGKNYDNSYFLISSYIQMDVADKIKTFLKQEKAQMQDRIKRFSVEQEKRFKDLYQTTLDNKLSFLRMIEAIKVRHNIENTVEDDEFNNRDFDDKENNLRRRSSVELINSNNNFEVHEAYLHFKNTNQVLKISGDDLSTSMNTTVKSLEEFDSIFDIDDLDANQQQSSMGSMYSYANQKDEEGSDDRNEGDGDFDDDLEERRDNVFPLKESNTYSSVINQYLLPDAETSSYSSSAAGGMPLPRKSSKLSSSLAQQNNTNKNFYGSKNDDHDDYVQQYRQVANSLPIQIPHFAKKIDRQMEESFRIIPGESIADSIQKLARSVRNENDILDDRPRRRLNTGDLIKSRPLFN